MEREWQEESLEAGEVSPAAEASAAEQTADVHAPQGPLGLVFQRESTVLSRVKDSSPLLHKVQVGWTLVSVDGQDVSRMDGWAVTKVISARVHDPDGRMLKFKALPAAEPAAPATSMAAAAGARARTSIEEQPVDGEIVTSPTSSENIVDAEPVSPASDLTDEQCAALAAFAEIDTDGDGELSAEEIARFVGGFHAGEVADYQMTAFCMAVFLRGMSHDETAAMTLAMANSGVVMDWFAAAPPSQSSTSGSSSAGGSGGGVRFVDKHSTGGVGDKVSLVLAPLLATFGLRVPMMSGRGLGHTGGTLDKVSE